MFRRRVAAHQDPTERYLAWFEEVCQRTATLMVHWMRVGFVHGVMNTDNLSILGETIDYGPYGWLEGFDPDWTPNTTDAGQKTLSLRSTTCRCPVEFAAVGECPLSAHTRNRAPRKDFGQLRNGLMRSGKMMVNKLGLSTYDAVLTNRLLKLLTETETDMTLFFRHLADVRDPITDSVFLQDAYYAPEQIDLALRQQTERWLADYLQTAERQNQSHGARARLMNSTNPLYVPRNYIAQLAIDEAQQGDFENSDSGCRCERPYTWQKEWISMLREATGMGAKSHRLFTAVL